MVLEYLYLEENVMLDAVYSKVKTFNRSNEYCNYNQIFTDFELIQESDYQTASSHVELEQ